MEAVVGFAVEAVAAPAAEGGLEEAVAACAGAAQGGVSEGIAVGS